MEKRTIAGALLLDRRNQAGLTQRALADACDLSHVFIGEIERGARAMPGSQCSILASALGNISGNLLHAAAVLDKESKAAADADRQVKMIRASLAGLRYQMPLVLGEIEELAGML